MLGPREHQGLRHLAPLEQREQERRLELLRHRVDRLRDADGRRGLTLLVNEHRVTEHLARQRRDRRRHGGAEEQRLPLAGQVPEDLADLRQEAHVEHPVGLVEHQELEAFELRVRLAEMVQQAAGRRDDDVDAAAEGVLLRSHADAAEDGGGRDRRVHRQVVQVFDDLRRELARGREHQRAGGAAGAIDQGMEDRQEERHGLAAAGGRAREQVASVEGRGNGVRLDGGGAGETEFLDALEQGGMERETTERHENPIDRNAASRASPQAGGRMTAALRRCRTTACFSGATLQVYRERGNFLLDRQLILTQGRRTLEPGMPPVNTWTSSLRDEYRPVSTRRRSPKYLV